MARRVAELALLSVVLLMAGCGNRVRLIAHRGGVVDAQRAENTPGAIEAAIARGYWMVELDVRESLDGRLVVHHDPDFERFYGDQRLLADLPWSEIRQLRTTPGNERPPEFHELAALCRGKLRVMLDTKPPEHGPAFYAAMEKSLRDNGLLKTAYAIGTDESRAFFTGKCLVGVDRKRLRAAVARGESVAKLYFLFEHGRDLDRETVTLARRLGVPVVASVNIFHYEDTDHRTAAPADIARLRRLGVTEFQIDSVYEEFLSPAEGRRARPEGE